jgi:hypothetical protein
MKGFWYFFSLKNKMNYAMISILVGGSISRLAVEPDITFADYDSTNSSGNFFLPMINCVDGNWEWTF